MIGLFCKRALGSFAKETYHLIDPTCCGSVLLPSVYIHTHIYTHTYTHIQIIVTTTHMNYGVATISRLLKITGLFGKRAL